MAAVAQWLMNQATEGKIKEKHPEIKGLILLASSAFLFLSLVSFTFGAPKENWLGLIGYYSAYSLLYLFGLPSYFALAYAGWIGWKLLLSHTLEGLGIKTLYFSLFLLSICLLLNLFAETHQIENSLIRSHIYKETFSSGFPYFHRVHRYNFGGALLYYLYRDLPLCNLQKLLSNMGVFLTFSITGIISFILFTNTRLLPLIKKTGCFLIEVKNFFLHLIADLKSERIQKEPIDSSYATIEKSLQQSSLPIEKEALFPSLHEEEVSPPSIENASYRSQPELLVSTHLEKKMTEGKISHETLSYKGC
ncbi:MAG: DNA translocase FtsK 4TM domain-containing protein [Simkania negevensis]|nr:DNA translocase FtsK 4TM domain-containing protein [Simkania negevensis]